MNRHANCDGEDDLLVTFKTPLSGTALSTRVPAETSVGDVLQEVKRHTPRTPEEAKTLQFLTQESSLDFGILALSPNGMKVAVNPAARVGDLAVVLEARTAGGLETYKAAVITIQGYQAVGIEAQRIG